MHIPASPPLLYWLSTAAGAPHLAAPPAALAIAALAATTAAATAACTRRQLSQLLLAMCKVAAISKAAVTCLPPVKRQGSAKRGACGSVRALQQLCTCLLMEISYGMMQCTGASPPLELVAPV